MTKLKDRGSGYTYTYPEGNEHLMSHILVNNVGHKQTNRIDWLNYRTPPTLPRPELCQNNYQQPDKNQHMTVIINIIIITIPDFILSYK